MQCPTVAETPPTSYSVPRTTTSGGNWCRAAAFYRAVLARDARQAEAWHGLGVLTCQAGDAGQAAIFIQHAIASQTQEPRFHYSLGNVFLQQGNTTAAAAAYQRTVQLAPAFSEAYHNLGVVYQTLGQWDGAAAAYETVLHLKPHDAEAHSNLGLVLKEQGRLEAAQTHCQAALSLQPDCAAAHHNLGLVYQAQGDLDAARQAYEAALRLHPDAPEVYNSLGRVSQTQGDLDAARRAYETALRLRPNFVEAHSNLGTLWQELGDLDAALAAYETALHYQPDHARAHFHRALVWLMQGNLAQGWPAYEWRWHIDPTPVPFPQPRWDGTSLRGKTILVSAEQGIGDEILFASCLPDLIAQADHCVIECAPRLATLFGRAFPTATVHGGRTPDRRWLATVPSIDVQIPVGSLPRYLRPTLDSFPVQNPYLRPDAARKARYQQHLAALGTGLKVGIAWRSRKNRHYDPCYTDLAQWQAVLAVPGVHFINLQYDDCAAERAAVRQQWGVTIHSWEEPDLFYDLDGTAALLAALDLIVAPDITTANLAGGLGQPIWQLRVFSGSWPAFGTDASPWFPSMRVFQQTRRGDWTSVLTQVAEALKTVVSG